MRSMLLNQRGSKISILSWLIYGALCALLGMVISSYASPWWDSSYANRSEVVVINNTSAASGTIPVFVMLKPYNITPGVNVQADGDDIRVIYYNGTTNTEIDRVFSYQSIIFKIQATISANSRTSDKYWIYWSKASATGPPANIANIYAESYTDFSSGWGDWTTLGCVSTLGSTVQFVTSNTLNSECVVGTGNSYTTDARRVSFRFRTAAVDSNKIEWYFTWSSSIRANAVTLTGVNSNAITLGYSDTDGGTYITNSEQVLTESLVASEWYSVEYEMLDHSIVGRIYRESTGTLIGSWAWGRTTYITMDTENQWLSASLYFSFHVVATSASKSGTTLFDDWGIGVRQMPDVMPFYFSECGYKHKFFYEDSNGDLYSGNAAKIYKSTNQCASATLLEDFLDNTYKTDVDDFSIEGFEPKFSGAATQKYLLTSSISTTYVYHRHDSLKLTTTATSGVDRYYSLGQPTAGTMNGFVAGTQYTLKGCVYVPSGQGITLSNVKLQIVDNDGAWHTAQSSPTAFDTWQCISTTMIISATANRAYGRLIIDQDIQNASVYWDKIQRDTGASAKSTVFFGTELTTGVGDFINGIYKRNGRLFFSFDTLVNKPTPLLYSDDEGVTWNESIVPVGGNNSGSARFHNWSFTSNSTYLFVGQYSQDDPQASGGDRLFRSSDNGATFTLAHYFNAGPRHIHMAKINPYDGDLWISVGDNYKKIYYVDAANLGNSLPWTTEVIEITNATPANLGLAFKDSRAVSGADFSEGNKIKSTINQSTWNVQWAQGGNFDLQTWDIAYHTVSGIMFAAEEMDSAYGNNKIASVACSLDDGKNWQICYEAKKGVTHFYNAPHSFSYPSAISSRIYMGVSDTVPNLSYSLYYVAAKYNELNPLPINPGIHHGINFNIMSRRDQ